MQILKNIKKLMESSKSFETNILFLGQGKVGKTTFFNQLQGLPFSIDYCPTTGRNVYSHELVHDDVRLKMTIWDTAGSIRYRMNVTNTDFRNSFGIIYFYSVDSDSSFEELED